MLKQTKIMTVLLLVMSLIGMAFAAPINIEDYNIEKRSQNYIIEGKFVNAGTTSVNYTEVEFYIPELNTSKVVETVKVEKEMSFDYSLSEVTDNFDLLKYGQQYTLVIRTDNDEESRVFTFADEVSDEDGLGISINDVFINDVKISKYSTKNVQNGQEIEVRLIFTPVEDFDNGRLAVSVEGYEHRTIRAETEVFRGKQGIEQDVTLKLQLPSDMDSEKKYKLRITGANDLSGFTYRDYNIHVDTQRHRVDVIDFIITPNSGIEPGQNIIASARVKNRGQNNEESVKVTISVEKLGIVESSYISSIEKDEAVTSDDMLIYVDDNTEPGTYEVDVKLSYNDGYTETVKKYNMNVLAKDVEAEQPLLVSYDNNLELEAGKAKEFEFVVANRNEVSKAVSIVAMDDASVEISVSPSLKMVEPGSDGVFKVSITPKKDVKGEKQFTFLLKEENEVLKELALKTYVEAEDDSSLINWTNIVLAVLLIIAVLILLSLVAALFKKDSNKKEEITNSEDKDEEEYY